MFIGSTLAYANINRLRDIDRLSCSSSFANWLGDAKVLIGMFFIAFSVVSLDKESMFPGYWALFPTVGTSLIISAGPNAWLNSKFLSNRVMTWIGLISYPLYLWHWPLLTFIRIIELEPSSMTRLVTVIVSIVLAYLTYKFIERPLRYGGKKGFDILTQLLLVLMVGVGVTGLTIYIFNGLPFRNNAAGMIDITKTSLQDTLKLPEKNGCLSFFKNSPVAIDGCASNTNEPEVLILGDSHAGHYYKGLIESKIPLAVIWNASCPPFGLNLKYSCVERWKSMINYTKLNKNTVKIVVISIYYSGYLHKKDLLGRNAGAYARINEELKASEKTGKRIEFISNEFDKTISAFEDMGVKVGLSLDIPELAYMPSQCLKRNYIFSRDNSLDCPARQKILVTERGHAMRELLAGLTSHHPGVKLFDPMNYLCDESYCYSIFNKKLIYWDDNHLNDEGSKLISKPLTEWILRNYSAK